VTNSKVVGTAEQLSHEVLDYGIEWSTVLESGESIVSAEWWIDGSARIADDVDHRASISGSLTIAWVRSVTPRSASTAHCAITTSSVRVHERVIQIRGV
jgi:hypothetical protein